MKIVRKAAALGAALAVMAMPPSVTAQEIEPRIAPESSEVIQNTLRQLGIDAQQITVSGPLALVDARVDGQPVTLEVDRFGGAIRVTQSPQSLRPRLQQLQPNNAVVLPEAKAMPAPPRVNPTIVPVLPRLRIEPRIVVPQD